MYKGPEEGGRWCCRTGALWEHTPERPWKTPGIFLLLTTMAQMHRLLCFNVPPELAVSIRGFLLLGPSMLEGCLGSPKHCLKKKQPSLGRAREEGWLPGDVADTPKGGRRGGAPASTSRGERNAGKHVSHEGASSANSVLLYYREHRTQLCNKFESPDQIELWKI